MRPPNPGNKQRRIKKILDHSRRLFARYGFDRVSMDRIASACRLTKPAIYYYFRNKRALLYATLQAYWKEQAAILKDFSPSPDFRQTLCRLARLALDQTRRPENNEIIRIVLAETARHPELSRSFFEVLGPEFGRILLQCFRPHLSRRYSERELLALYHHFVGSLAHYSLMSQIFKPDPLYLPSRDMYVNLLIDNFVKVTRPIHPQSAQTP